MTSVGRKSPGRIDISWPRSSWRLHGFAVRLEPDDVHSGIVETRAAAEIGQRIRHERVGGQPVPRALPPEALRQHDRTLANRRFDSQRALYLTELVEHLYGIAVFQSATGAVGRVHQQRDGGPWQFPEGRA